MDFILQDSFHEEHDAAWAIFSHHYHCPVCLGCIVETLEQSELLCIQKKPAITELLRLLTHQSPDILQLFIQKEQIVWHLAEILLGLYLCMLGNFSCFCCRLLNFFKINFFKNFFQEHHTGQCKRTGGCYNELVVAFLHTGDGLKGKKIYTC